MPDEQQPPPNPGFTMTVSLPKTLTVVGEMKSNWRKFNQLLDSYEILTGLGNKPDKVRVVTFLTAIGIEALDIHNNIRYKEEAAKQNMTKILQYWSDHCEGQTNVVYERYLFNVCVQGEDPFDSFLLKLRSLVATCEYGTQTDEHIRDRIVCGVNSKAVRKQLFQKNNINLGDAISLFRAIEASTSQLKIMQPISGVNVVKGPSTSKPSKRSTTRLIKNCKFCGEEQERDKFKCPAYKKTCKNCVAKITSNQSVLKNPNLRNKLNIRKVPVQVELM